MGTRFKGEKKKVQSLNSFIKLSRASESIRNEINIALKAKRLSESQFYVLDALYFHGELLQRNCRKVIEERRKYYNGYR
jgi:hypothetical protein